MLFVISVFVSRSSYVANRYVFLLSLARNMQAHIFQYFLTLKDKQVYNYQNNLKTPKTFSSFPVENVVLFYKTDKMYFSSVGILMSYCVEF